MLSAHWPIAHHATPCTRLTFSAASWLGKLFEYSTNTGYSWKARNAPTKCFPFSGLFGLKTGKKQGHFTCDLLHEEVQNLVQKLSQVLDDVFFYFFPVKGRAVCSSRVVSILEQYSYSKRGTRWHEVVSSRRCIISSPLRKHSMLSKISIAIGAMYKLVVLQ